ncbi:MAG: Tll0287-like domain-containing protein [Pseudomonadota bacterium]
MSIRSLLLAACAVVLTTSLTAAEPDAAALATARARAELAISEMQRQLKLELQTALQQGGGVSAIRICRERAPAIAAELNQKLGVSIRRTSERWRNPVNAPDTFESGVLKQFAAAAAAAPDINQLRFEEVLNGSGAPRLHVMQAIALQGPCVMCHGTELSDEIRDSLRLLYPSDHATGFSPGELRGAFSVSVPLEPAPAR